MKKVDLSFLKERWPSEIIARSQVANFTGGALNEKVIARLDGQGAGPKKIKVNGRIAYPVNDFIQWLQKRAYDDNE